MSRCTWGFSGQVGQFTFNYYLFTYHEPGSVPGSRNLINKEAHSLPWGAHSWRQWKSKWRGLLGTASTCTRAWVQRTRFKSCWVKFCLSWALVIFVVCDKSFDFALRSTSWRWFVIRPVQLAGFPSAFRRLHRKLGSWRQYYFLSFFISPLLTKPEWVTLLYRIFLALSYHQLYLGDNQYIASKTHPCGSASSGTVWWWLLFCLYRWRQCQNIWGRGLVAFRSSSSLIFCTYSSISLIRSQWVVQKSAQERKQRWTKIQ